MNKRPLPTSSENREGARRDGEAARLRAMVEALPEALFLVDPAAMRFVEANRAALRLWGSSLERLREVDVGQVLGGVAWEELGRTPRHRRRAAPAAFPITVHDQTGKSLECEASITPVELPGGARLMFLLREVENGAAVDGPAGRDSLTGLPDRRAFLRRLEAAVRRARREPDARFAVLFVDLDRFKSVNDGRGHLAGDRVLREIGHRLRQGVRPGDMVARWGGDEFTVLVDGLRAADDVRHVVERLLAIVARPMASDEHAPVVTASIGVAVNRPGEASSPEELLDAADRAMYRAKALGRARWVLFDRQTDWARSGRVQRRVVPR